MGDATANSMSVNGLVMKYLTFFIPKLDLPKYYIPIYSSILHPRTLPTFNVTFLFIYMYYHLLSKGQRWAVLKRK